MDRRRGCNRQCTVGDLERAIAGEAMDAGATRIKGHGGRHWNIDMVGRAGERIVVPVGRGLPGTGDRPVPVLLHPQLDHTHIGDTAQNRRNRRRFTQHKLAIDRRGGGDFDAPKDRRHTGNGEAAIGPARGREVIHRGHHGPSHGEIVGIDHAPDDDGRRIRHDPDDHVRCCAAVPFAIDGAGAQRQAGDAHRRRQIVPVGRRRVGKDHRAIDQEFDMTNPSRAARRGRDRHRRSLEDCRPRDRIGDRHQRRMRDLHIDGHVLRTGGHRTGGAAAQPVGRMNRMDGHHTLGDAADLVTPISASRGREDAVGSHHGDCGAGHRLVVAIGDQPAQRRHRCGYGQTHRRAGAQIARRIVRRPGHGEAAADWHCRRNLENEDGAGVCLRRIDGQRIAEHQCTAGLKAKLGHADVVRRRHRHRDRLALAHRTHAGGQSDGHHGRRHVAGMDRHLGRQRDVPRAVLGMHGQRDRRSGRHRRRNRHSQLGDQIGARRCDDLLDMRCKAAAGCQVEQGDAAVVRRVDGHGEYGAGGDPAVRRRAGDLRRGRRCIRHDQLNRRRVRLLLDRVAGAGVQRKQTRCGVGRHSHLEGRRVTGCRCRQRHRMACRHDPGRRQFDAAQAGGIHGVDDNGHCTACVYGKTISRRHDGHLWRLIQRDRQCRLRRQTEVAGTIGSRTGERENAPGGHCDGHSHCELRRGDRLRRREGAFLIGAEGAGDAHPHLLHAHRIGGCDGDPDALAGRHALATIRQGQADRGWGHVLGRERHLGRRRGVARCVVGQHRYGHRRVGRHGRRHGHGKVSGQAGARRGDGLLQLCFEATARRQVEQGNAAVIRRLD